MDALLQAIIRMAGQLAGEDGVARDDNPYLADCPARSAWELGWLEAQAEAASQAARAQAVLPSLGTINLQRLIRSRD